MRRNKIIGTIAAATFGLAGAGTAATAIAATSASAATAAPAVTMAAHVAHQWKLNGPNRVTLTYQGHSYSYNVRLSTIPFSHNVELVTGTLTDTYEPHAISLPIQGVIFGNDVVLSVQYPSTGPDAGNQGDRTFSGSVDNHGHVSGLWSETGSEAGSGQFSLLIQAR